MINSAAEFPFEISIDNHLLWIVASDGADIEPLEVTSVIIHPGETMDVEIETNQIPGKYWIRARIPSAGNAASYTNFGQKVIPSGGYIEEVNAILKYEGTTLSGDPQSQRSSCTSEFKCRVFNCPFPNYPAADNKVCIPMSEASSPSQNTVKDREEFGLDDSNFEEHFFNVGFNWGSSINGNKFVYPTEPFSQRKAIPSELSCNKPSCSSPDVGCVCTNVVDIPFNTTVQFVLTNYEPHIGGSFPYMAPHPIHLHGHNFAVLKMGFAEYNETTALFTDHNPDVVCSNRLCKNPRWNGQPPQHLNLENPPVKDTIVVPAKGYVVIRFKSNNPGYWPMHCHAASHHSEGMNILFREAPDRIGPVPEDFPTCKYFGWSQDEFEKNFEKSKRLAQMNFADSNYDNAADIDQDNSVDEESKARSQPKGKAFLLPFK